MRSVRHVGRGWGKGVSMAAALLACCVCCHPQTDEEVNLVGNPGFEEGGAGWNLPLNYVVTEEAAHSGRRSLRVTNTDPAVYRLATQPVSVTAGRRYAFGAWVKTRGVSGDESGATVCMEWYQGSKYLGGAYPSGVRGDSDWQLVQGQTGPIPDGADRVSVTLYLRRGMTGTAWFDDVYVRLVYPPALDAALLLPNYRGWVDPADPNPRVLVRATVGEYLPSGMRPDQASLTLSLQKGEREVRRTAVQDCRAGDHFLNLPARKLEPGQYRAVVLLRGPNGGELGRRVFDVTVPAPGAPRPKVYIDRFNRCIVDGKPFF
ncbi:MAG: carbohydrate binding domain-containing protein, partial [Armatimonadota bacterium]|nr:carbohydrate binding domain-containing protein [Armatimonadota bacterium]